MYGEHRLVEWLLDFFMEIPLLGGVFVFMLLRRETAFIRFMPVLRGECMQATEVKALLEESIPGSKVLVEGEGCDFRLTVISDQFEGALPVKRQQMVYKHLNELIASGAIHAVTMTTQTPSEAQRQT